ncbi:uncharacterized protein LOC108087605 [Drosophila ficusphila]|uniref:uncharacterized protein LOC108087605 n=1 Tax=Drosophila ficusphila TaxID=30025 RepID=UPI001C89C354|nr:uncharacterized protein LOC108087605 [Drosophila ficusphila]
MLDVVALLLVALAVGFWFVRTRFSYWTRRGIGNVPGRFPVGNMDGFRKTKHFIEIVTPIYEKFKNNGAPFAGFFMMLRPVVLVTDLELAKQILIRDFANFEDRGMYHNERDDPLTGHLFRIDGPKWRPLRQKMSPTFSSAKMKYMFPTVCEVGMELAQVCGELADNAMCNILEISDLMARYTSDVIGRCAFGVQCNGLRNPEAEFAKMGRRAFLERRHCKLIDGFIESFPDLARLLRMRQIHQDITDFYVGIVRETVRQREEQGIVRNDFMNLLIEMKQRGELTIEEMAAQAFIFFVAGFDTSASTLGFALYELAKQPDIQVKLRQEIEEALQLHQGEFTYDSMQELRYMELVIAETLRKYPILPQLTRISRHLYAAKGDRHFYIEPDQMVLIPVYGIHHDPAIYPEPHKFIPERFLADELAQRPTAAWLPFGDGPRNCIGMRFGKMQTTIGLVSLLRNFHFSVCPRTDPKIEFVKSNILLCSANGIYLKVQDVSQDWPKKQHIAKIFQDYYLRYKGSDYPFAGFYFFFTRTAVITDLELVKRVMIKDFNHFENRGVFYNEIDDPLSATLFSIEGQKWRHLRHKLTPTFTSGKMKHMFPIVVKVGEEMEKVFSGKIALGEGSVLEVVDLVARYTADVIGNCAFGLNCNSLYNPQADFVTMGKRAIVEHRYGNMLDIFLFGFPKLSRRLRLKLNIQEAEDFYTRIVRETIDYRLKSKEKRNDFMDSLIEMYKNEQAGNSEDETLRKYPVLAHLTRMTESDFSPEDPKYFIAKGTIVVIPALGIHYDPEIYPEPEKFKPERFTEEEIAARPSCTWLPFGEGPRNCIGLRFGLMQTCVGLAYLIKGYKFSVAPETQIPMKIVVGNILISAENGIHLKVEKFGAELGRRMSLLLSLIALLVSLILFVARRRHGYWQRRGIPHDVPHPLFGNMGDWPKKRHIAQIFRDYYMKYKGSNFPFAGLYFFFTRSAVITDLELVKRVLIKDFNHFENRGIFWNEVDDPLSATLFSIEGQKWRHLRHKLTPTFTSGKMKNMFPLVVKVGKELEGVFSAKTTVGQGKVLEVVDLVARYTADVIGNCAFGLNCNSLHNPQADFVTIGRRAIIERRYGGWLDFLIFGFPKLSRRLHLKLNVQDVEDFYTRIVRETIDYRLRTKEKRNDFMDSLIDMYQKEQSGNTEDGMSFNEILAQAFIFFVAGFETSSTTMGFALYELAQNQEVQDKVREEIASVLAKHNNEFTYEGIKEMKYLEQVVMETLRKYPVLAHLTRITDSDFSPEDPKYFIAKGTVVVIPALGIHYDPDIYPDPEQFNPERFTEEAIAARPSCTWLPFGEGPRNCIGLRFGLMQTCIGLAYLIKGYKFSVAPETQIPMKIVVKSILLSAENGIHLKVEKLAK